MNKKLFSTLFIIVILASFSVIGCKNPNTDPGTTVTGTDIGEKYAGTWYLNATPNLQFSPESPSTEIANAIINLVKPSLPVQFKNDQYTINTDGSIAIGTGITQDKIEKNKISKEGNNKYIADLSDNIPPMTDPTFSITAMKESYTFTDAKTATVESYIVFNIDGKSYNLYIYKDGTFTTTQQQ
ncbi:hypothetical protein [Brachyspira intermedia]|uniref:hypothetical protein n=1 Tax=Brachyspira intermedia TaxID=84377 RepID=UPI003004EE5E